MKKIISSLTLLFLFSSISYAQNWHQVFVGPGMTFTPSELNIEVGDSITFMLEGGTHDVNFGINTLNGQSFDNPVNIESIPTQYIPGIMGTITFDIAGTFNYDCSLYGHASMGMVGQIIVSGGVGLNEIFDDSKSLIKMIDIQGRIHKVHQQGQLLFYIYENGKVEKRIL
jgi:plastocyanin